MFVWKVMTAEKAQKLLRRHVMDNVQKYIIKQIKTFEGKWCLENLGYNIEEVMEEELIIKW